MRICQGGSIFFYKNLPNSFAKRETVNFSLFERKRTSFPFS